MIVPHKQQGDWTKNGCKLHLNAIIVSIWCQVMFFVTKFLCGFYNVQLKEFVITSVICN
jgi:hypothetical protein